MGQFNALVTIGMAFSIHYFSYIDVYLDFEGAISDDTPIFNVSEWKLVRSFYKGEKAI